MKTRFTLTAVSGEQSRPLNRGFRSLESALLVARELAKKGVARQPGEEIPVDSMIVNRVIRMSHGSFSVPVHDDSYPAIHRKAGELVSATPNEPGEWPSDDPASRAG